MTGFAAIVGRPAATSDPEAIYEAINPLGLLDVQSSHREESLLCAAHHKLAPCRGVSFLDGEGFSALLAGDVVNHEELSWPAIRKSLASGEPGPDCLSALRGSFGLILVDHERELLWAITDPHSWQPVMMMSTGSGAVVTSSLAVVLRSLPESITVNDDWVYEKMYFSHPAGRTTPIIGADRLPPGTITQLDLKTWRATQRTYRTRPKRLSGLRTGNEAVAEALEAFKRTVPRYHPAESSVALGLSEGLDCRAVLAATPRAALRRLHSFTFGVPHSSDIKEADRIARRLGLAHTAVLLDEAFLEQLPRLAHDTVFLSDGLQGINRSHLLYTYSKLNDEGQPYSVIMTGVSGDHIFRDHIQGQGNVPHIMSPHMASIHRGGRARIDAGYYTRMFGERFDAFNERISKTLEDIEQEYGEFGDPETYFSYLMYEAGPRYFGGQAAIANAFSTFRTPYWDPDIVQLGYRLQEATIGFSAALKEKDAYRETRIQAAVIAANDRVGRLPYKDLPIGVYASGNRRRLQAYRALRRVRNIVRNKSFVYSEDWRLWYRTAMKNEVLRLLGADSRVRVCVTADFIDSAIATADVHWLGKLITAEHTLRLIENGWRRTQ